MLSTGWGKTVTMYALYRITALRQGCDWIVSDVLAADWEKWGLATLADRVVPIPEMTQLSLQAAACSFSFAAELFDVMRCQGTVPHAHLDFEVALACDKEFHFTVLQMFAHRLAAYRPPYQIQYLGLHTRHGDKASTSISTFSFRSQLEFASRTWSDAPLVFISTDDSSVLSSEHLDEFRSDNFTFRWTVAEKRWNGGSPKGPHDHDEAALAAVLEDVNGLARASKLVGSLGSNFFKLAWILNNQLHAAAVRPLPWCLDMYTSGPCADMAKTVEAFHDRYSRLQKSQRLAESSREEEKVVIAACGNV